MSWLSNECQKNVNVKDRCAIRLDNIRNDDIRQRVRATDIEGGVLA